MIDLGLIEDFIQADDRAAVRARLLAAGWRSYEIGDRGRYEVNDTHDEPPLVSVLTAVAATRLGVVLAPVTRHWARLRRGDYALFKDDDRRWRDGAAHVEVHLDLSEAASDEGQIIYVTPDGNGTIQQKPGLAAVVDRRREIARYERYLGVRFGDAEIVRLSLMLRVAG